ncbi:MAG: tetratricopeptide repeat protein [Microvirga sp.]
MTVDMSGFSSKPDLAGSGADAELQWAIGALNHGRPDEAERFARNVLARIPQHGKASYLLGCALLQQNRPAQAVAPLERAARALQDPAVETQLGLALRQVGRTDDALTRLRRATKRRPAHAEAFHELGYLLLSSGRIEEAVTVVEHGIQLAPGAVELPLLLGVVQQGRGDGAKAKAAFAQALAIAPDHPGAHYGMGMVLADDAEYAQSAEHLQRALASNAADVQARLKLAVCLLELGRTAEALGNFRAAVHSDPSCYGTALTLVSCSARGRFWLRPSTAKQQLKG